MAKYLARKPMVATRTVSGSTITYSGGKAIGKLIQTTVTPTVTPAELFGDDARAERISEFVEAAVTLNTTNIPREAYAMMFGATHTDAVTTEGNEAPEKITYSADDEAPCVGYGFVTGEVVDGVRGFKVTWLPKVTFSIPAETYDTKGKNIVLASHTISGVAEADENRKWREEFFFTDVDDALAELNSLCGVQ